MFKFICLLASILTASLAGLMFSHSDTFIQYLCSGYMVMLSWRAFDAWAED